MQRLEDDSEDVESLDGDEYHPFDDHPWIFHWGYREQSVMATNDARQAFLKNRTHRIRMDLGPTTPLHQRSAEVLPHLSCQAAIIAAEKVLGVSTHGIDKVQRQCKVGRPLKQDEQNERLFVLSGGR